MSSRKRAPSCWSWKASRSFWARISEQLRIPTIGIGAGRYTDGQVLVWHDMLGFTSNPAKFVKIYAELEKLSIQALDAYASEVKDGSFPGESNTYYPIK